MKNNLKSSLTLYNVVIQLFTMDIKRLKLRLEVTQLEVTHKVVTSGFPEIENPVFGYYSTELNP